MSSQPSITLDDSDSVTAIVGLGSNLHSSIGSPEQIIALALTELETSSTRPMIVASLYATEPVDCPPNTPLFINTVAALFPAMGMTAIELLEKMQDIESRFGRERSAQANQPRTLDLDLICFGNQQSAEAGLVLPHPRAHGRLFVLQPLAEIAPDLVLPGQLGSVQQLLSQLSAR